VQSVEIAAPPSGLAMTRGATSPSKTDAIQVKILFDSQLSDVSVRMDNSSINTKQTMTEEIIQTIVTYYPDLQAIYLFGSTASGEERLDSDIDIAVLLPPRKGRLTENPNFSECLVRLESLCRKTVDLVDLRHVSTVFQKEIIATGQLLYCADRDAVDTFEMLTLSYYQKLNEERKDSTVISLH
jgi:predicted nucleotidyltransferase